MDVTFTNVLEGARQYFQGLPTATSSTAGPTYSNPSENHIRNTNDGTDQNTDLPPPSSSAYWTPQQEREQRPSSHHSDTSSRPPSHPQMAHHYQGNYQQEQQQQQQFQFPRPQSREAPSNQNQYHHMQQYHNQPQSPQNRPREMVTPPAVSQTYHQMQNVAQTAQGYYQQQRYYQTPAKPSNNSYKIVSTVNTENAYHKHLYTQQRPAASTLQYQNKIEQPTSQQNQNTSQTYRTTHNLPPIASLSLISYHSNRNSRDVVRMAQAKPKGLPNSSGGTTTTTTTNTQQPKSSSSSTIQQSTTSRYPQEQLQHDYNRTTNQYQNQNRLPSINQNYQYCATTTTQNYTQVIMTTTTTSTSTPTSYSGNIPSNQSSAIQQQYYQNNKIPQNNIQRNHLSSNIQQNINGNGIPPIKQKRESPLDLSVKTVRTPADSTLDDTDQNTKYYPNRTTPQTNSLNYPTYDVYANSFQRNLQQTTRPSATAPKVEFHPNFNVSGVNHLNNYRRASNAIVPNPQNPVIPNKNSNYSHSRYPTGTVPTAAHVNSYIQNTAQLGVKRSDNLPRIEFPSPGHGHKTSALYPAPSHDTQKKRPADTAPSIIPNKISKVDTWRQSIDQQIEQRLSSYKQQQAKQAKPPAPPPPPPPPPQMVNGGNYAQLPQNTYQNNRNQQYHQYSSGGQYAQNHNQTYVPSATAHQYPGFNYPTQTQSQQQLYAQHNLLRTNTNSNPVVSTKNNLGGANKTVLSLLRNSLEIKGAKEAQKKLEQEQMNRSYENMKHSRLDVQHPSTDVTAPLQPKPGFINRHNVSPFTPTNLPENNNSLMYKLHIPKAIDSVNFECESGKYLRQNQHDDNSQVMITNHVNPGSDLDGLAALVAARIRTKAELKQVSSGSLHSLIENQLKTPMKQDPFNGNSSVSPPKLNKERHQFPPRRRLFSRNEDEGFTIVPPRDKTGLRSSSETSVFDFPDTDSESEMPVLERQTLEDMRRDRRSSSTKQLCEIKSENFMLEDDIFAQACDNFMEQLKNGSGKKRGRRKKIEPDVLAKLETVTKEKPLETDLIIKKEISDETTTTTKTDVQKQDDDDDVPLIKCKMNEEGGVSKKLSTSLGDIRNLVLNESKEDRKSLLKELLPILPRPAKKPSFGDGSHFYPGWEEEVYKYKKSLRMPPSLIQVTRPPQYHRLSTSLPDLDPCPNSPTPSSFDEFTKTKLHKIKTENLDSDSESNHSFNIFSSKHYDSEGSSSIKSLPNTTKESCSILDQLLERYGGRKKKKYKRKDAKILPKSDKIIELLPTPGDDKTIPFRKKTIENFKDIFNKTKNATRTRRLIKQKVNLKEVFGEDRPASAPPVTCLNHIKIKEEADLDDNINLSSLIKKENQDTRQVLKNKLLSRGRKENNLLKSLVDKKIKSELLDDDDDDHDSKSETPSIDGDEGSISTKKQRNKFRNIRRKFSSGFDYIRKKKKSVKKDNQENEYTNRVKRRGQISKSSGSVQDIQKEIKGWVLNKGIGETILHRSARLGYTDITAYCLEKMEYSPSPKDNAGYTPLHEASTKGHLGIAKMLLMYGASVHESARGGIRPLHEAVENGFVEIVRLLLSYGADPKLATYSGMTPLALASDDATIKLLQNHINDVDGNPTTSWVFPGPATCFDAKDSGLDVLADEPTPDPISDDEDVDFEISDCVLPNLYTLRGENSSDRWVLLQDLSTLLKIKSRDALLRQICPSSGSSANINYKSVLRELKMSDFLEQAHCCQFLNIGEKVNTRASKIALVKYTDKVRELLNVENFSISVR